MIDRSKDDRDRVYLQVRPGYSDIYMRNGKRWLFYREKLKEIDGEVVSGEPLRASSLNPLIQTAPCASGCRRSG
jgi:hypothetical protein